MALKKETAQSGKASERFVLVGTYKGDQLDEWRQVSSLQDRFQVSAEIMPDFAATLAANHPDTNVINEDTHIWEAA